MLQRSDADHARRHHSERVEEQLDVEEATTELARRSWTASKEEYALVAEGPYLSEQRHAHATHN